MWKRGEKDGLGDLVEFARRLEEASLTVIREGTMTGDLCLLWEKGEANRVTSSGFMDAIAEKLKQYYI